MAPGVLVMMQPETRQFLSYLQAHPEIRHHIKASPDKTLLYAGKGFKAAWVEIADLKRQSPDFADKEILPDVIRRIPITGEAFPTLLEWVDSIDRLFPW